MFIASFVLLAIVCVILRFAIRENKNSNDGTDPLQQTEAFKKFRSIFLVVYFIVMGIYLLFLTRIDKLKIGADWLQGPYVYALYESYGFQREQIGSLFIAGFLASGVMGTFIGGLAD